MRIKKTLKKGLDKKDKLKRVCFLLLTAIIFESLVLLLFPAKIVLYENAFPTASMQYLDFNETSFAVPDSVILNMKENVPFSLLFLSTNYITVEDAGKMQIVGPHFYLCTGAVEDFPESKDEVQEILDGMMPKSKILVLEDPIYDGVFKEWRKAIASVSLPQYLSDDGWVGLNGSGYVTFVEDEEGKVGALLICSDGTTDEHLAQSRMEMNASVAKSYRMERSNGTFVQETLDRFHKVQMILDIGNIIVLCIVLKIVDVFVFNCISSRKEKQH